MGCQKSKFTGELQKKELVVATLNYCGIMNNPFEFYCQDFEKELGQISAIFEGLLPRYFKNYKKETFKWEMGKIDVKVRLGRYSPVFSQDAGIQNQRFVTCERFRQLWDQVFDQQQKKIGQKFTTEERENAKQYDLICFHALLKFVYNQDSFEELIKQNTAPYRKKLKPFFELSFLDQKRKLEVMIKNFEEMNIDIFFTQEYSRQFEEYIDSNSSYIKVVDGTKDTMIVARKSSFRDMKYIQTMLTREQIESFNLAGRTSFLCLDNLILINVHLTSKPVKNKPQLQQLRKALINFRNMRQKYDIILAGDLNSFFPLTQDLKGSYQMFPDDQRQITTSKKRTLTQAQFNKANIMVQESKDKIITNMRMKNCMILHIDRTQARKDELLPKNNHPFDHFVVVADVYK